MERADNTTVANFELLDHPKPPSFPNAWPLVVRVHDDWTIFLGNDGQPLGFYNETHGLLLHVPDEGGELVGPLREWGAKVAVANAPDTPHIYQVVRVTDSHAAQVHGNSVMDVSLVKAHGRRQRVRAAVQTGLATGTAFAGAVLRAEHLPGLQFGQLDLTEIDLSHSTLVGTEFSGARLGDSNFRGCKASGARFDRIDARRADFSHIQAPGALFHSADLELTNFANAELCSADFSLCRLVRADLRNTDLRGANLSGAELEYANLDGANLSEANLTNVSLVGASLSDADFSGATLNDADLVGADARAARGLRHNDT